MSETEMFKTTLMGGYDKDDVQEQFQKLKDEAAVKQKLSQKEIQEKDVKIQELQKRLELKEAQQARLEAEVEEKYQKYIDNYENIGKLVFESKVRADEMVKEAEEKGQAIIQAAEKEAKRRVDSVQSEVNDKLADGKKKYVAVQDEMNEIVELINQAQRRFMSSYKEVHRIISTMPTSLRDMEEKMEEEIPAPAKGEKEVHLGDTDELEVLDTMVGIGYLDEYDTKEEMSTQLPPQMNRLLEEDLDEIENE